jgi:hypothetical protein
MSRWNPEVPESRFWKKVGKAAPDSCWIWNGGYFRNGYGAFVLTSKKILRAHRMAYELVFGEIEEGAVIRHTCDNPKCVNPKHLLSGTQKDNMDDKTARGRGMKGRKRNVKR